MARRVRSLWSWSVLLVTLAWTVSPAQGYEVWVTDQSDTGKESGGLLHIYDGAQLAAAPASAKPMQTIDFAGELGKFCEDATKKTVRRPHMLFFNAAQDHVIISFLSGQVLFMDAATKKPEACLSYGEERARGLADAQSKNGDYRQHRRKEIHPYLDGLCQTYLHVRPGQGCPESGCVRRRRTSRYVADLPDHGIVKHYAFVTLRGGGP